MQTPFNKYTASSPGPQGAPINKQPTNNFTHVILSDTQVEWWPGLKHDDDELHLHECVHCGQPYSHAHPGGETAHGQYSFQCPWPDCSNFIAKGVGIRRYTTAANSAWYLSVRVKGDVSNVLQTWTSGPKSTAGRIKNDIINGIGPELTKDKVFSRLQRFEKMNLGLLDPRVTFDQMNVYDTTVVTGTGQLGNGIPLGEVRQYRTPKLGYNTNVYCTRYGVGLDGTALKFSQRAWSANDVEITSETTPPLN